MKTIQSSNSVGSLPEDITQVIPSEKNTARRPSALTHFVILPALIVVGGMVSMLFFGLITNTQESAYEYLNRIRSGNPRVAERAAADLAQFVAMNRSALSNDERFIGELLTEFNVTANGSALMRPYLALALGKLGNAKAESALLGALQESDPFLKVCSTVALGDLKSKAALPLMIEGLKSVDVGLRLSSAGALGEVGDKAAIAPLAGALLDSEDEVRWNAAIALAKLGDSTGKRTLVQMLTLEYYTELRNRNPRYKNMREELITESVVGAMKALALLGDTESLAAIERIARDGYNESVRWYARNILNSLAQEKDGTYLVTAEN